MDHENQDIPQSGQGNEPREVVLRYEAPVTPIVERYVQPTPLPGQPKKHTSPRKKRKGLKIFLFCMLGLLLVSGVVTALWLGGAFDDHRSYHDDDFEQRHDEDYYDNSEHGETTIKRLPNTDQVKLRYNESHGEALTIQEIYQKVNPSTVTVLTGNRDGSAMVGTGVIFTEDGFILTNAHVIAGGSECYGVLDTGEDYRACLLGLDEEKDLAVIKIAASGLPAAEFGDSDALTVGEVGYVVTGLKDPEAVRVGDTLTWASNPCPEPLPGYREAKPMVYTGLFPIDTKDYENLRDALDKLHVNDPSLVWEPETSVALGFGFRVGFLGLLHMEVVKERLEREFNLDLIATSPSVDYHVYKTDGEMIDVRSPQDLPEATRIERIEEPYLKAKIICPPEYTGAVMQLAIEHRGITTDMIHLTSKSVEMRFDMPLAELILDFFDQLKSRTKGYASLDYEFSEYRPSELVKLDILLSGDEVDALSFIVHKDKAYGLARGLCDKLKEIIPRQLFEVPIQAAIGGRIIARETVKAMRKDVLAKCYGGDITRKKKLLEKQKEGKKKMRNLGTVQVPTEAFMAVLKLDSD